MPDEGGGPSDVNGDVASERRKESSQRFSKKRDEDVVDYISGGERIAREMRYVAETTEGERIGDWTPPSPMAMRTTRFHKHSSNLLPFFLFLFLYLDRVNKQNDRQFPPLSRLPRRELPGS